MSQCFGVPLHQVLDCEKTLGNGLKRVCSVRVYVPCIDFIHAAHILSCARHSFKRCTFKLFLRTVLWFYLSRILHGWLILCK